MATIERKLREALDPVKLEVIPAYGDPNGSHVSLRVVSKQFEGKRSMQRQQMVYKVLWDELQSQKIHAVDKMEVLTPQEAGL
mmetsp:Transcript_42597/g.114044  ORF Transcript_42597/g.114044 Transcript_42597/m.114044 type:complete len:82 (-) Transcript_42597:50-295(-)